jgi:hypothetical protein
VEDQHELDYAKPKFTSLFPWRAGNIANTTDDLF